MALTPYEKQKRWREKNRALYNLQQRNRRKGKSGAKVQTDGLRDEATADEISGKRIERVEVQRDQAASTVPVVSNGGAAKAGYNPPPRSPFETKKVGEFRMIVLPEEKPATEAPENTDTRSRSDIAMGIWRNDQGGVISKFAYDKLQKMKEHAKENNFEMDDYSQ